MGLDFSGISLTDKAAVERAIERNENFYPYFPTDSLTDCRDFIIRNQEVLEAQGALEPAWLSAHLHASHRIEHPFATIKSVFDRCDRSRLRSINPIDDEIVQSENGRVTVFRGCAGLKHTMGMSWTRSLETAIKYARRHVNLYELTNAAVYVAIVLIDEIYCQLDPHYDEDLIVVPNESWKIDLPPAKFAILGLAE